MVMSRGVVAPLLLKWFVSRDVPTGVPFSNGTLIRILIPSFLLLIYLHSMKFRCFIDKAKSGVLVKAGHLQLGFTRILKTPKVGHELGGKISKVLDVDLFQMRVRKT
ncbi:hypothetical protein Ahy_A03g015611 isoform B [Arachis hypogaea]|nr:hypothetical protein Ahy_A03g015611 isoform B [Arachis hypogaea]